MDNNLQLTANSEWMEHAACRGVNPNLFFPDRGDIASVAAAKAVCAGCEVRAECLQYAIDTQQDLGIWGGATRSDFQAARRGRPRQIIIHGTEQGYHAHRRLDEEACTACRRAHADQKVRNAVERRDEVA